MDGGYWPGMGDLEGPGRTLCGGLAGRRGVAGGQLNMEVGEGEAWAPRGRLAGAWKSDCSVLFTGCVALDRNESSLNLLPPCLFEVGGGEVGSGLVPGFPWECSLRVSSVFQL